ncbi:MAG: LexA family transcriptional regulator [bacterium]
MSYEDYKQKITNFYRSNRRMPCYSEIMSLLSFKSKNAVFKLVNKLIDDGIIEKDSTGKLSPRHIFGEVSLLGVVEAGIPTTAEEEVLDTLSLDEWLLDGKSSSSTYMLEVKGDSMIEAHISEGDYVLVERIEGGKQIKDGEIIVAEIDGGWTLKYLKHDKHGKIYLQPANKKYSNIYPEYDLQIAAVVKAVIRKLK